jgi:hypothetical protein
MSDQMYSGQGPDGSLEGATGTQPPQVDLTKKVSELEAENAKLREERRTERAKALGAEHGLTPTETELLTMLKADEMEAKAAKLAEERKAQVASTATTASTVADPAPAEVQAEVPDAAAIAAMGSGGQSAPSGEELPAANSTDAMVRELNGAKSFDEVQAIQEKYKRMSLEQ